MKNGKNIIIETIPEKAAIKPQRVMWMSFAKFNDLVA
jgi:hypothetical protein